MGKRPVTVALLRTTEQMLNYEEDNDHLVMWAAVLTAFHFMMRSSEYLAKLTGGRFDMDKVLRRGDVRFFAGGKQIYRAFERADEVRIVFGRSKTTEGGEVRPQFRAPGHKLCVVEALAKLCNGLDMSKREEPLFAWRADSRRAGEGARYCDMMKLLKVAGEKTGLPKTDMGSHSLRRGGACFYLLAGLTLQEVKAYGRWAADSSLRLYVEGSVGNVMQGMAAKGLAGQRDPELLRKEAPRTRDLQVFRAKQRIAKELQRQP